MPRKLKEFRITFKRVSPGEDAVDGKSLGLQSKLGGDPRWIQQDETPSCSACFQPMSFVGQIDSVEHDADNNPLRVDCIRGNADYMFGDVGLTYVFFCFDCLTTQSVFQCT